MKQILQKYLQYSKRIAIFGITQWAIVAILVIAIAYISTFINFHIEDTVSSLLKNIITSSSTLAVAISSGYYAHSAYDKTLNKPTETTNNSTTQQEDVSNG